MNKFQLSPSGAIGCPAMYLYILSRHKDRIQNPTGPDPASQLQSRAADPVLKPFKFLFAAYRPEMWWYEVIETVRRLTMTGLLVLFPSHDIRPTMAIILSFLSILMHNATEPFTDPATNTLALVSHLLVFMVFFVGDRIGTGTVRTENFGIDVLLVILLFAPPVLMAYSTITQARRDRIEALRRREREVQVEEMRATLNRLKDIEDEVLARDEPVITAQEEAKEDMAPPPPPAPPPLSANISTDDVNFEKCTFPCYVMSLTNLCSLDQLPLHEDAYEAGLLQKLTLSTHVGIPTQQTSRLN